MANPFGDVQTAVGTDGESVRRRKPRARGRTAIAIIGGSKRAAGEGVNDSGLQRRGAAPPAITKMDRARARIVRVMNVERPTAQAGGVAEEISHERLPFFPQRHFLTRAVAGDNR